MGWIEWLVVGCGLFCVMNLALLLLAGRKARRAWTQRMEEIERRYTAGLCESGACRARGRMRVRTLKRLLGLT